MIAQVRTRTRALAIHRIRLSERIPTMRMVPIGLAVAVRGVTVVMSHWPDPFA